MADQRFNIPVRDRVLIHLKEFWPFKDALEVPYGMCQAGIATSINVNRSQVTRALQELRTKDLIEERKTYVEGANRRQKAYNLSMPGDIYVDRLKKILLKTKVQVRDNLTMRRNVEVKSLSERVPEDVWFSDFIQALTEDRVMVVHKTTVESSDYKVIIRTKEEMNHPQILAMKEPEKKKVTVDARAIATELNYQVVDVQRVIDKINKDEKETELVQVSRPLYTSVMGTQLYDPSETAKVQEEAPGQTQEQTQAYPQPYPHPHSYPYQYPYGYGYARPRQGSIAGPLVGGIMFAVGLVFAIPGVMGLSSSAGPICCGVSFLFMLIGALMMSNLFKVRGKDNILRLRPGARKAYISFGVLAVVLVWASIGMFDRTIITIETLLIIASLSIPLYAIVFIKGIPMDVRGDIGVATGLFLVLFNLVLVFFPMILEFNPVTMGILVTIGCGLMILGSETGGFKAQSTLRAMVPGVGLTFMVLAGMALYTQWPVEMVSLATLVLWIAVGVLMVAVPFLKKEHAMAIYRPLGRIALICFASGLVVVGIALMFHGFMVGVIELFIAAPVLHFGYKRFKEDGMKDLRTSMLFMWFLMLVEIITLVKVLFFY